ncbi:hypothetical protein L484_016029 [Morus notabilis]|uniref:Ubiquitin-activating enzyme E1 four-helix bundle domain-containing protein n=1 Tax=Morus notabilis TaxID=981085 RepID=W9RNS7_9ROSA|nr:hypothetical protein L484_016029 [Morus notabilis]
MKSTRQFIIFYATVTLSYMSFNSLTKNFDRPHLLRLSFQALDKFTTEFGHFLVAGLEEGAQKLISIAGDINESLGDRRLEDFNPKLMRYFAFDAKAVLNPMAAMFLWHCWTRDSESLLRKVSSINSDPRWWHFVFSGGCQGWVCATIWENRLTGERRVRRCGEGRGEGRRLRDAVEEGAGSAVIRIWVRVAVGEEGLHCRLEFSAVAVGVLIRSRASCCFNGVQELQ